MRGKITKKEVERLAPNEIVWDSEVVGLGVRRQTTEARHYVLRYPIPQRGKTKQRIMSIGRHGTWTPDQARREARRLLGLVASGRDPLGERETERERDPELTFLDAIERYISNRSSKWKPGSAGQITHHLRKLAQSLHNYALAEVSRLRIANVLDEIEANSGPVARNRTRTSLLSLFNWLANRGLFEGPNPVENTETATEGHGRDRVLTKEELALIWRSLGDDRFSNIVRLLILTAQRRTEIGDLRWSEVDFDNAILVLPPERVKNGRKHELPLSPQALVVLRKMLEAEGRSSSLHRSRNDDFVFGKFSGWDWSEGKTALDRAVNSSSSKPIPPWRLHDLRRTAATGMADLGIQPHYIEAVLNHVSGHKSGVAGIYNRATYGTEMREALGKWSNYVEEITA
jgi:integrase